MKKLPGFIMLMLLFPLSDLKAETLAYPTIPSSTEQVDVKIARHTYVLNHKELFQRKHTISVLRKLMKAPGKEQKELSLLAKITLGLIILFFFSCVLFLYISWFLYVIGIASVINLILGIILLVTEPNRNSMIIGWLALLTFCMVIIGIILAYVTLLLFLAWWFQ